MTSSKPLQAPAYPAAVVGNDARPSDALPVGAKLQNGAYRVGRIVGRGGFGITYIGADTHLKRPIALKELLLEAGCGRQGNAVTTHSASDAAALHAAKEQFLREAQALARFDHPGIVRVYTVFEENATAYMAMELLSGSSLREQIEKNGPFSERQTLYALGRIGTALQTVHATGLLHRDLNPSNIMDCDGRMVLIDFGLSRLVDVAAPYATRQLSPLTGFGTAGYAPIEQYGQALLSQPATDIYALGATAYFLLTGQVPVAASARAAGDLLLPPYEFNPLISRALSRAVMRAMEMDIAKRPQSVREFLAACPDPSKNATPAAPNASHGTSPTLAPVSSTPVSPTRTALPANAPRTAVPSPLGPFATAGTPTSAVPNAAVNQRSDSVSSGDVAVPYSFYLDIHTPDVPAHFPTDQIQWPTVVRVSARILDWPFLCPCCGAQPDARFHSIVMKKVPVLRQATDSWQVPFCAQCASVFHLTYQLPELRKIAEDKRHDWGTSKNLPVLLPRASSTSSSVSGSVPVSTEDFLSVSPSPNTPSTSTIKPPENEDTLGLVSSCILVFIWVMVWLLLVYSIGIPSGAILALITHCAYVLIGAFVSCGIFYILKWIGASSDEKNMGFSAYVDHLATQVNNAADLPATQSSPPQTAAQMAARHDDIMKMTQAARADHDLAAQKAHDAWQAVQNAVATADEDITRWNRQVGYQPRYALIEWRKLGNVHTFLFLNAEYARRFAEANHDKVVFNEQRPVVFDFN